MADVSLDDLIKKDKQQHKANKKVSPFIVQKFNQKKFQGGKKFHGNNNQDRQNSNNKDQEQDNRPFKKKFIKKQHDDNRNQPRDKREERPEKFKPKPPKQERTEEGNPDKQFRTLKVLGLSPEFTNEDLYVKI